jgi:hypothetical protein
MDQLQRTAWPAAQPARQPRDPQFAGVSNAGLWSLLAFYGSTELQGHFTSFLAEIRAELRVRGCAP